MTNSVIQSQSKVSITVDVIIVKEEDYYIAYCPALELSAYADSEEKARKSFEVELAIFLKETRERGTLEKYLLHNGWRLQQIPKFNYQPPRTKIKEFSSFLKNKERVSQEEINIPMC